MKRTVLAIAVVVLAAPAMAATDVNLVLIDEGCAGIVAIYYDARSAANLPRAFALDITVDDGYIASLSDLSADFWVFPGSIDINEAGEVNDVGTPIGDPCDLPGDTLGGLWTDGITLEMGSLYVGAANAPDPCGLLCKVYVTDDCNLTVAENLSRGKVVLEGATQAATNLPQTVLLSVSPCNYTISGNVSSGAAPIKNLAGVVMNGLPGAPVTDANGNYWDTVSPGWSGAVTPTKVQWSIPSRIYIPVYADALNENYTGTATECLATCDVGYAYWATHGKPDCWCCRRQCHGDADCQSTLNRPVNIADNNLLKAAFGLLDAQLELIPNGICADFDHDATLGRRVTIADNNILKLYFGLTEASVPQCPATCINEWTD